MPLGLLRRLFGPVPLLDEVDVGEAGPVDIRQGLPPHTELADLMYDVTVTRQLLAGRMKLEPCHRCSDHGCDDGCPVLELKEAWWKE